MPTTTRREFLARSALGGAAMTLAPDPLMGEVPASPPGRVPRRPPGSRC